MKTFEHTIQDPQGLHARPAGQLAQTVGRLESTVNLIFGETEVSAKKVIGMMRLCLKQGATVTFQVEGDTEEADAAYLAAFCRDNL